MSSSSSPIGNRPRIGELDEIRALRALLHYFVELPGLALGKKVVGGFKPAPPAVPAVVLVPPPSS